MPTDGNALAQLQVIDRLEVGPVVVSPRRLVAPYTVVQGGRRETTSLIYRYQEPVFAPKALWARNLASLIAAQVALNYGLFCRELVLHGPFTVADRRFLTAMARHTAREIYVNKLLFPNPFILPLQRPLPSERASDFLLADLRFEPEEPEPMDAFDPWPTRRGRLAILSSGGKDSLLSHGLATELGGYEVHPIYVNESGRHWYTALNAFRHFEAQVPHTARVWTSADRLFAWMLRHLPLVRQDFATLRSDEYPIRLWTVAVFLFGALPLLRLRGVGRLLIGDEFDTTLRLRYMGITHYGGLYDQSRYFDEELSRFFGRRGFGVCQFSILRPLSELLIEKVLVERYPELQRHQVSCHATHLEGDRVHPCGRCEKCRRIVAMLTALGADPTACGYTREQIESALVAFAARGVHQEAPTAQQTCFLLHRKGLLKGTPAGGVQPRPHPEVQMLRFDEERAPLGGIPRDLRRPLYAILLEHAEGAVQRRAGGWQAIDPLTAPELDLPYRHEPEADTLD